MDALGDGTRMALFQKLAQGPMAVHELAAVVPVSRPAVSQHLRVLKQAGLVTGRAQGRHRIYQVEPDGLALLRADLDRFWGQTLAGFQAAVEQPREEHS
jgi:DNA-binding transcriptional ArsR family regulator